MAVVLLLISFAIILVGALMFTNAVEWAGHRMNMGEGATGSLIAAVGTAMPETLIPIVAIIAGGESAEDVAIGAIIGAPFLLATIAMGLVGFTALLYRRRRKQGTQLVVHVETLDRDLVFFLLFFAIGLGLGLGVPTAVQIPAAILFVAAYGSYVRRTLRGGGAVQELGTLAPLFMSRTGPEIEAEPSPRLIAIQFLVALGAMIGGAHLFVEELVTVAEKIGVEPLVLALVLAPLATELPEKANSFFWIRQGKDSLALGNITGAMVFQSTLPIAFGLAFTSWDLSHFAIVSAALGLAGGAIAYWALRLRGRFEVVPIVLWSALFFAFLAYVAVA